MHLRLLWDILSTQRDLCLLKSIVIHLELKVHWCKFQLESRKYDSNANNVYTCIWACDYILFLWQAPFERANINLLGIILQFGTN